MAVALQCGEITRRTPRLKAWYCATCAENDRFPYVDLDVHGRCGFCGSDNVDFVEKIFAERRTASSS